MTGVARSRAAPQKGSLHGFQKREHGLKRSGARPDWIRLTVHYRGRCVCRSRVVSSGLVLRLGDG
jgi:hypothetical protein